MSRQHHVEAEVNGQYLHVVVAHPVRTDQPISEGFTRRQSTPGDFTPPGSAQTREAGAVAKQCRHRFRRTHSVVVDPRHRLQSSAALGTLPDTGADKLRVGIENTKGNVIVEW